MYAMPILASWYLQTSASLNSPRMEEAMDTAAASPPVNARCTPDEKNGSMNAERHNSVSVTAHAQPLHTHTRRRRRGGSGPRSRPARCS